ncbi:TPA: hypothetical protein JAG59_002000 [Legionella pneumophila]|nr:hypothetical protein [Legionella pneumophila]HAT5918694.1 hypothetical protein [Legionella pneumophila]HAT5922939.1 hypothetical protein [Legionella pneumophila]HAT5934465.1 hypothetical protein [Legionella pneumophila]HAT5950217.1 hypothetical protein [Legionella pneumophila]
MHNQYESLTSSIIHVCEKRFKSLKKHHGIKFARSATIAYLRGSQKNHPQNEFWTNFFTRLIHDFTYRGRKSKPLF